MFAKFPLRVHVDISIIYVVHPPLPQTRFIKGSLAKGHQENSIDRLKVTLLIHQYYGPVGGGIMIVWGMNWSNQNRAGSIEKT